MRFTAVNSNQKPVPNRFYLVKCGDYSESGYEIAKYKETYEAFVVRDTILTDYVTHFASIPQQSEEEILEGRIRMAELHLNSCMQTINMLKEEKNKLQSGDSLNRINNTL